MKKLISMTDFVLQNAYTNEIVKDFKDILIKHSNYAEFLKQPLTLSMFIPTDENGVVLEEPEFHEPNNENEIGNYDELRYKYQQAKSKVIFEGFEVKERSCNDSIFKYVENGLIAVYYFNIRSKKFEPNTDFKTIEDLIPYNLTLIDKNLAIDINTL